MHDLHNDAVQLNGLIENFASTVAGVEHALVFSVDGLPIARSSRLEIDAAERLSTVAAATIGLAEGSTEGTGVGAVREVMIVMEHRYLFVTRVGHGAALAVVTSPSADVDLIGYQMGLLVDRSGSLLTPELRSMLLAQAL